MYSEVRDKDGGRTSGNAYKKCVTAKRNVGAGPGGGGGVALGSCL